MVLVSEGNFRDIEFRISIILLEYLFPRLITSVWNITILIFQTRQEQGLTYTVFFSFFSE